MSGFLLDAVFHDDERLKVCFALSLVGAVSTMKPTFFFFNPQRQATAHFGV
jgi:hypothetical protein